MYPLLRRLCCLVPSAKSPAMTPSGKPVDVPGIFQTSQWVTSPFELFAGIAGSGSFMISTKLCVPGGTCDQLRAGFGEFWPAAPVYLSGITPPSSQAVDVMINGGVCGPRPAPRPCPPPGGACATSARLIEAVSVAVIRTFALMRSPFSLVLGHLPPHLNF